MNALGDTLSTTPVIHEFRRLHPQAAIIYVTQAAGFCRVLDQNPDIDLVVYSERLYLQGIPDQTTEWLSTLPLDLRESATLFRMDLKLACTTYEVFREHISKAFARLAGVKTQSVRPILHLTDTERRVTRLFASRPYIVLSPHTVSNPQREDGRGGRKDWPRENWEELARTLHAENEFDLLQIGAERDELLDIPYTRKLYGLSIRTVAALIEGSAALITLESGIAHLGAAVDAPMVIIYSNMMPREWAAPSEASRAEILYGDPFELDCRSVLKALKAVASSRLVTA